MDRPVETAEERESLAVAEGAREKEWTHPSVLKELFLGRYRLDLVAAIDRPGAFRPEFKAFYDRWRPSCGRRWTRWPWTPRGVPAGGRWTACDAWAPSA
jgi:hypothetical protein